MACEGTRLAARGEAVTGSFSRFALDRQALPAVGLILLIHDAILQPVTCRPTLRFDCANAKGLGTPRRLG